MDQIGKSNRRIRTICIILLATLIIIGLSKFSFILTPVLANSQAKPTDQFKNPNYIYILVYESKTANDIDSDRSLRSDIVGELLQFAASYHWIGDSKLYVEVLQYQGNFKDGVNLIWPESTEPKTVELESNFFDMYSETTKALSILGDTWWKDSLDIALSSVITKIEGNLSINPENSMVILITEGRLNDLQRNSTCDNLEKAAASWRLPVPLGVIVFSNSKDSGAIGDTWRTCFFEKNSNLKYSGNLHFISTSTSNSSKVRQLWLWITNFYKRYRYSQFLTFDYFTLDNNSTNSHKFELECIPQKMKYVIYGLPGEEFALQDSGKTPIPENRLGNLEIRWWEIENELDGNALDSYYEISVSNPVYQDFHSLFGYNGLCIPTPTFIGTNEPTFTPTPTKPATTYSEEQKIEIVTNSIWGFVGGIAFLGIVYLFSYAFKKKIKGKHLLLFYCSWFTFISTLLLTAIYIYLINGKLDVLFTEFFATGLISFGSFIFAGGLITYSVIKKEKSIESAKPGVVNAFVYIYVFIGGVFLMISWFILFSYLTFLK